MHGLHLFRMTSATGAWSKVVRSCEKYGRCCRNMGLPNMYEIVCKRRNLGPTVSVWPHRKTVCAYPHASSSSSEPRHSYKIGSPSWRWRRLRAPGRGQNTWTSRSVTRHCPASWRQRAEERGQCHRGSSSQRTSAVYAWWWWSWWWYNTDFPEKNASRKKKCGKIKNKC